jgi:hypothetical protein
MTIKSIAKIIFLILIFHSISLKLFAQEIKIDTTNISTNKYRQMDAGDFVHKILKKSFDLPSDTVFLNSRGPFFTPLVFPGYAMVTGYIGEITSNISFYTLHTDSSKISSILVSEIYSQYHQWMNIINSNIWTNHELFNLQGDWRYYIFPNNTFGLGSKTTLADATPVNYSHLRIYEVALRKLYEDISIGLGYNLDYYLNIKETKDSTNEITDMDRYGCKTASVSSGITANIQFDNLLNSNNPVNGSYVNIQLRDNLQELGSNSNWQSLIIDIRHYFPLSKSKDYVLALWSYDWLTLDGKPPYFDLPYTGGDAYNNTGRGYVEGRYKGLNYLYGEAEFRFRILNNGFIGGSFFTNVSSFSNYPANKFNGIDPGTGVGLRIKMNKKSNVNLAIDYGIGIGVSHGFVFNLSEVF